MELIYVSALSSSGLVDKIHAKTGKNPGFAAQKFNRMVAEGLAENGAKVMAISTPPILHGYSNRFYLSIPKETENGVIYDYTPYFRISVLRRLFAFIIVFFKILIAGFKNRKDIVVVCDVLNISICLAAVLATKIAGIPSVGVVTDMPGLMIGAGSLNFRRRLNAYINKSYLSSFSSYVFLTEAMNEVINPRHRPYIVMEGLVDGSIVFDAIKSKRDKRIVYAGGLFEQYGVKMLVEAFIMLGNKEFTLELFGDGSLVPWIKDQAESYGNVVYKGIAPNSVVVESERNALLLVNPRPTSEKFTIYSFPSKNMEYMLSGTAVLTTRLPGMPSEYFPYVYLFDEESTIGYKNGLDKILSLPETELCEKGKDALAWVLANKNNRCQAGRIINLIRKIKK